MIVRKVKHLVTKQISPETWVILNLKSGRYYTVNKSAAMLWRLLDSNGSLDALYDNLVTASGQPIDKIREDVGQFIEELTEFNLVEEVTLSIAESKSCLSTVNLDPDGDYQPPVIKEHDSLKQMTAGTSGETDTYGLTT